MTHIWTYNRHEHRLCMLCFIYQVFPLLTYHKHMHTFAYWHSFLGVIVIWYHRMIPYSTLNDGYCYPSKFRSKRNQMSHHYALVDVYARFNCVNSNRMLSTAKCVRTKSARDLHSWSIVHKKRGDSSFIAIFHPNQRRLQSLSSWLLSPSALIIINCVEYWRIRFRVTRPRKGSNYSVTFLTNQLQSNLYTFLHDIPFAFPSTPNDWHHDVADVMSHCEGSCCLMR